MASSAVMGDLANTFLGTTVALDERGLWPLAAAREHLASLSAPPTEYSECDTLWQSLVSLADADEFIREARRLAPLLHPRGMSNTAVHERYGDAILPWLADGFDAGAGSLSNTPWNTLPCLLKIGSREAFELVAAAASIDSQTPDFATPEKLQAAYAKNFPAVAFGVLAERLRDGDKSAGEMFKRLAKGRSKLALGHMAAAVGEDTCARLAKQLGITARLEIDEVIAVLDEASADDDMFAWPRFCYEFDDSVEYSGMRMVAARASSSEAWGIALERITGCNPHEMAIQRYLYGSEVTPGFVSDELHDLDLGLSFEFVDEATAIGATVTGPAGELTLTKELIKSLDLRPGKGSEPDGAVGGPTVVLVRAYLESFPGAVWPAVPDTLRALGLDPEEVVIVAATDAFRHEPGGPYGWLPSNSKMFKTVAAGIVASDPNKFKPGKVNTSWRTHARHKGS